ncbi:MAG: isoprenyl transferase [Candidatus Omnitrophica bacterium]|nr:isoprenyl transferase [Candidatus Omnitrophota bacterium]
MMVDLDPKRIPQHVAIIMDGNGRWAKKRGLTRPQGHLEGVKRVGEVMDVAREMGIKVLTLFAFSTENWNRPQSEVEGIMKTMCLVLNNQMSKLQRDNIRVRLCGRREGVPDKVWNELEAVIHKLDKNTGLTVNLAFNYGSRGEIVDAIKNIAKDVVIGKLSQKTISEETVGRYLYTKDLPDPDLLIRTSGEQRISNFLLWQLSYAEFLFTEVLWPDFTKNEFKKAILDYQKRDRRFGKVVSHQQG